MTAEKVYVVTGASRGLGLGFVESLLRQPDTVVVAAARSPDKSEALQALLKEHGARLHTVALDSADDASVKARHFSEAQAAAEAVDKAVPDGVDYLINNAGVADAKFYTALETEPSEYMRVMNTNTVGSFRVTQAFYPLLKKRQTRTVVNVSSGAGSIAVNRGGMKDLTGKIVAYASSKAALNMQTSVLAGALKDEGFTVVSTCPGWVATDMGTNPEIMKTRPDMKPDLTVEESTEKHLALIHRLTTADSGKYFSAAKDGAELPY